MKQTASNRVEFKACLEDLPQLCGIVTEAARGCGMDDKSIWKLEVSLDEACTNIACYGYKGCSNGAISVEWKCDRGNFVVVIEDEGVEFDQSRPTQPDFDTNLCDRKPGGLGRYIMREFMDGMEYERRNGRNVLTLVKRLREDGGKAAATA